VDTSSSAFVSKYTNDVLDVSKISVTPSSYTTGRVTTYTLQFQTTNPIPGNGYLLIQLPSEVSISDASALPNACMVGSFTSSCSI
jgi:hypothetical protein